MIAGLLVNSGVGLLVLFKVNKNYKENFEILGILYVIGVISGIVLDLYSIVKISGSFLYPNRKMQLQ